MANKIDRAKAVEAIFDNEDLLPQEQLAKLYKLFPECRDNFAYIKRKLDDAIFECEQNALGQVQDMIHDILDLEKETK